MLKKKEKKRKYVLMVCVFGYITRDRAVQGSYKSATSAWEQTNFVT